MSRSIPHRWLPYTPCGTVIEGTRIICFKVPLKKAVQCKLAKKFQWNIETLLRKIPSLGAVIDLTNTQIYYNPSEFVAAGVLYKKIFIPGRMIPPQEKVDEFFECLDKFLSEDSDKLVGVHCTHGLNRTGYLVCRYMRDRLSVPPEEAIARFEKARGYHIERENYIADLLGKSPPPPSLGPDTDIKPVNYNEINRKAKPTAVKHSNYKRAIRDSISRNVMQSRGLIGTDQRSLNNYSLESNVEFKNQRMEKNSRKKDVHNIDILKYKQSRDHKAHKSSSSGYTSKDRDVDRSRSSSRETKGIWSKKRRKAGISTSNDEYSSSRDSDDSYSFIYDY